MRGDHTPNSTCIQCGVTYYVKAYRLAKGLGQFCSNQCQQDHKIDHFPDRFWELVDKSSGPDGCWPFRGTIRPDGYGATTHRRKTIPAHRIAYELTFGKIPAEHCICHRCDNRPCCNPSHLFIGTLLDNISDMVMKHRNVRGGRHGNSKLTDEQAMEIVTDSTNSTPKELSEKFGVTLATVKLIQSGKSWKHLHPPN